MRKAKTTFDIAALQASLQVFDTMAYLLPIHTEAEYDRMAGLMNALLDVAGDDDDHSLSGLLELVSDMVSQYEQKHHAI